MGYQSMTTQKDCMCLILDLMSIPHLVGKIDRDNNVTIYLKMAKRL
jgi:hypothetical protein